MDRTDHSQFLVEYALASCYFPDRNEWAILAGLIVLLSHYCLYCGHCIVQQLCGDDAVVAVKTKTANMNTTEQWALLISPWAQVPAQALLLCLDFCLFMREK